jgi:hypothetical protein
VPAPNVFLNFNTFLREFVLRERRVLFNTRTISMRDCKASEILLQAWRKTGPLLDRAPRGLLIDLNAMQAAIRAGYSKR